MSDTSSGISIPPTPMVSIAPMAQSDVGLADQVGVQALVTPGDGLDNLGLVTPAPSGALTGVSTGLSADLPANVTTVVAADDAQITAALEALDDRDSGIPSGELGGMVASAPVIDPDPSTTQTPLHENPLLAPAPLQSDTSSSDTTQTEGLQVNQPSGASLPSAVVPSSATIAPATMRFSNILEVLVANHELDQSVADKIMVDHISTGETLESLLTKENLVNENALTKAKSALNQVPFIDLSQVGIYPEALNRLPEGVARNYKMLPFELNQNEGTLSVAMIDPLNLSAIDFAQQKTGLRIKAFYAVPSELERLLAEYYSQSLSSEVTEALAQTTQAEAKKKMDFSSLSKETIRQAPITKIVETILTFAIKARASDVHIEPLEEHTRMRYRIDGILAEKLILPRSVHEAVVSRIKILSGLKIDEKRVPQDGRFNFVALDQEVDLRVSTLPTIHGEKIVMRLLKKDQKVPSLPELGLNGVALRNVQDAIKVPHGIILITGPTGSGKTTTLYSILHVINSPKVNIMTLEDPVEYQMTGVNQVQINPQAGLTFASGLRSFLRQDPNIIMVGEIRDSETAELAIQASLTGHLVFSTLHTSSATGAIPRLMDMGAEPFLLASSMTLVMGQRVMRLINADFKEEYKPEKAVLDDFKAVLGPRFDAWLRQKGKKEEDITLMRPMKNRPQNEPDYKGRVAIFEVMKMSETIVQMILNRKPASDMEKVALDEGMLLMKQDGYLKVLDGLTTIEEVLRVAQI